MTISEKDYFAARAAPQAYHGEAATRPIGPVSPINKTIDTLGRAQKLAGSVCEFVDKLLGPSPESGGSARPKGGLAGILPAMADAAEDTDICLSDAFEALARLERTLS